MFVGIARYELLLLTGPQSLKEKRSVVRRLRDRLRNLQISAAEVDAQDIWGRTVLGVACVGSDQSVARTQLDDAEKLLASFPEVELINQEVEVMPYP